MAMTRQWQLATTRDYAGRKECRRCHEWLPEESFGRNSQASDGLAPRCRPCVSLAGRERRLRSGKPLVKRHDHAERDSAGRKYCLWCDRWMAEEAFGKSLAPSSKSKDGLKRYCRACITRATMESYRRTKGAAVLARKYGITPGEYQEMLTRQGCSCAICGAGQSKNANSSALYVDHCHATGRVRGLLCHHCNAALGHLQDSPDLLRMAADYLEGGQSSKP